MTLLATRHRGLAADLERLERGLGSDATILLLGGPGTGKDRLARLLHDRSPRAAEPFVRVDVASLSDDLLESELFGHERGAFTGAVAGKAGLLEGAGRGTLYFDRIDTLSLRAQGKLLRLLEERLLRRVGGTRETLLEARFVASAAPDLPRRVRAGEFREDLWYRVAVITVRLPPLAERRADLLPAARALLRAAGGPRAFTPEAVGLRPFSVGHVTQPWRTAREPGDLAIAWTRRSRALAADSWTAVEAPLAEEHEAYEIEVLDGTTIVRTLAASTSSVTYTAAQQLADLGALLGPGDTLPIRIFQLSALVGRGAPASVTLQF